MTATDGNIERAIDWIFSHLNELDDEVLPAGQDQSTEQMAPPTTSSSSSNSSQYRLVSFISHMGTSTSCGHYVCHVKSDPAADSSWLLFNDNKVAFSKNPPKDLGYLYIYQQI